MSEIKLQPCPFCGSEHIALNSNDAKPLYSIDCENCGCGTRGQLSPKIAADVWNKRVDRTDEIELKPCPFCGGKADIIPAGGAWKVSYFVECQECNNMTDIHDTSRAAVETWNRRIEHERD